MGNEKQKISDLEIRNSEPNIEVIAPETVKKRAGNNLKILITDDDFISGKLANRIVLRISREIISANSGKEAIEICRNNPDIDLILMDISMPQIDGYEVTRRIRQFNQEVIIIAQTAKASAKDIEDAMKAGCNDHIPKPINGKELLQLIQKYFDEP